MLSANMRNQTASIATNTHENPYLESLFHAMYPKTSEFVKFGRRSLAQSSTKSIETLEANTQQLENGYRAISADINSRWTIGDPRVLLFEDDDEDFQDDSSNLSSESGSDIDTVDDGSDLYSCSGDFKLIQ
jgi:hypothetical protein